MLTSLLLLLTLYLSLFTPTTSTSDKPISLACLLMVRDEAFNIRNNIPLWYSHDPTFFDAFVVAVDERTTDDTILALEQTIPSHVSRFIYMYKFDGFGNSRTEVFKNTWSQFPNITHVMVADPDWQPNLDLINKNDLSHDIDSYQFKIWDRSGLTTRNTNWLMRHTPGLYFNYYVHELLRFEHGGPYLDKQKNLTWEVSEVEQGHSWHQTVGHGEAGNRGASRTYKRFEFDLSLLEREQNDPRYTDSDHTLYYLGAVYCAMVEGSPNYVPPFLSGQNLTGNQLTLASKCTHYHTQRILLHSTSPNRELTYASHRWLPYAYMHMHLDYASAEPRYLDCINFDPERVDCPMELSKLYTWNNRHEEAYRLSVSTVSRPFPDRAFSNSFYTYVCMVPLQASRSAVNHIITYGWNPSIYALGHHLMTKSASACTSGFPLEDPNVMNTLRYFYAKAVALSTEDSGKAVDETFRCTYEDDSKESEALRFTGGQHYFCLDDNKQIPTPTKCSVYRENFRTTKENMNDRGSFGPTSFEEVGFYLGLKREVDVAYLTTAKTYEATVKSACVTSLSTTNAVIVVLGGAGSDGIEGEVRNVAKECRACSGKVEVVNIGEGWDFSKVEKFDYVDLGAGLLNLNVVPDPDQMVKKVETDLLKIDGIVGALTHEFGSETMDRIETLKSLIKRNDLAESVALELAEVLTKSALGYSSNVMAAQLFSIARGNVDSSLFVRAGFDVIAGAGGTGGLHRELYATKRKPTPGVQPLNENSILKTRNPKHLNNVRTKLMIQNKILTGHEALFPEIILQILNGRTKIRDIYAICNEESNRRGNYLDSNVLTLEKFLGTVGFFVEAMEGIVVAQ